MLFPKDKDILTESLMILDDDRRGVNKFRLSLVSVEKLPIHHNDNNNDDDDDATAAATTNSRAPSAGSGRPRLVQQSIGNLIKLEHTIWSVPDLRTNVPRSVMSIGTVAYSSTF